MGRHLDLQHVTWITSVILVKKLGLCWDALTSKHLSGLSNQTASCLMRQLKTRGETEPAKLSYHIDRELADWRFHHVKLVKGSHRDSADPNSKLQRDLKN